LPYLSLINPELNESLDLNNNAASPEKTDSSQQQLENDPIQQQVASEVLATVTQIVQKKPRNRKRKLKLDKKIILNANQMRDQIDDFLNTLREYVGLPINYCCCYK
jgi:hypothetical protein